MHRLLLVLALVLAVPAAAQDIPITFRVDASPLGPRGDALPNLLPGDAFGIRGGVAPVDWGTTTPLEDPDGDGIWEATVTFPASEAGNTLNWKAVGDRSASLGSAQPAWEPAPGDPANFGNRELTIEPQTVDVMYLGLLNDFVQNAQPVDFDYRDTYTDDYGQGAGVPMVHDGYDVQDPSCGETLPAQGDLWYQIDPALVMGEPIEVTATVTGDDLFVDEPTPYAVEILSGPVGGPFTVVDCTSGTNTPGATSFAMGTATGAATYVRVVGLVDLDIDTQFVTTAPEIAVSAEAVDFGTVDIGNAEQRTVTVTNEGDADLTISDISVAGGEFSIVSGGDAGTLAPSETQDVVVEFAPTAAGDQTATLTIMSDDADEGTVEVALSGTGTAPAPTACDYTFDAVAKSSLTVPSGGGRIQFAFGIDNRTNPAAVSVDVWATVASASGGATFVRTERTPMVGAGEVYSAGINQRIPALVPDDVYTYTLNAGDYDDADPSASEVCGSESFTVVKGDSAPTSAKAGEAAPALRASDWQDVAIVGEGFTPAALASVEGEEVVVAPNPTREQATFAFALEADGEVSLAVYDAQGREVAVVVDGSMRAGSHAVPFAQALPAGVYVWRLVAGDRVETGRLTVVR